MKTKLISKLNTIFTINKKSPKTVQSFLLEDSKSKTLTKLTSFLNIDEFATNPQFVKITDEIASIKTCGIIKLKDLQGKRAELTLKDGTKLYATSFEDISNDRLLKKYLVIKLNSSICGIGQIWSKYIDDSTVVFALEDCPFVEKKHLISVINEGKVTSESVNYYTANNEWFGKSWLTLNIGNVKHSATTNIKTILKPNVLNNLKLQDNSSQIEVFKSNVTINPLEFLNQNPLQIIAENKKKLNIKFENALIPAVLNKENLTLNDLKPKSTQTKVADLTL